jgi:hypothetical protein
MTVNDMQNNPTHCAACDNVTARTRQYDGWRWRCLMFPVPDIDHFLGAGIRATEPHGRCLEKNTHGQCPDFTPIRDAARG